jgi:hypothetical protein
MTESLTHWKKLKNPDYLGSYALQPGQELIVTIKSCGLEQIAGTDGKKQDCLVLHFTEADIKPMIINNTNAKTISKVLQTPYMEQWQGKAIQIYARRIRAFGEDVDALRIRDFAPQVEQIDPTSAIQSLHRSTTLGELKKNYTALTKAEQGHPEVISTKDKLKEILS